MSNTVDFRNSNAVMANFELRDCPVFAVYSGKDLKFFNVDEDIEAAKSLLQENLNAIQQNDSTGVYKIIYYDGVKDGRPDDKRVVGSAAFRLNGFGGSTQKYYAGLNGDEYKPRYEQLYDELNNKIDTLLAAKAVQDDDDDGVDLTDDEPKNPVMGFINGVLSHPTVQEKLIEFAPVLIDKLGGLLGLSGTKKNYNMESNTGHALGSIDDVDVDRLNNSLAVLFENGLTVADVEKLATMAANDKSKFTMLLSMLRS